MYTSIGYPRGWEARELQVGPNGKNRIRTETRSTS